VKKTYHVHIYKVLSKAELDVEADSSQDARGRALKKKDRLEFGKSDCKYLALDFLFKAPKEKKPAS